MLQFPQPLTRKSYDLATSIHEKIQDLAQTVRQHLQLNQRQNQPLIEHIFKRGNLKSALFSARIEGNSLTLQEADQIELITNLTETQREVVNLMQVHNELTKLPSIISLDHILTLHKQVMHGLQTHPGKLRTSSSAIFDQLGNITYLTPEPAETKIMLGELIRQYNTKHIQPVDALVNLAQCHYYFEKIHPFADGNGRVGRLLMHWQLHQIDYLPTQLPLEEFIDTNRSEYYFLLEKNTRQVDGFVLFVMQAIEHALHQSLSGIKQTTIAFKRTETLKSNPAKRTKLNKLIPRQQEIYQIILDHPYTSLDFIHRRFWHISKRTLAYDIIKLVKLDLITKHGQTRGTRYSAT